jgi:transcriptional regulator with XRE-family HTH domain
LSNKKRTIYPKIREVLFEREEDQKDLAKLIGVTESELSLKLHGKRKFHLEEIKTMCSYYGKDINELFFVEKKE